MSDLYWMYVLYTYIMYVNVIYCIGTRVIQPVLTTTSRRRLIMLLF